MKYYLQTLLEECKNVIRKNGESDSDTDNDESSD